MSKSNAFENDLLKLLFNATPIANVADNAAVSPVTNLYVGLHSASPGEAGDQSVNEVAYTGYTRTAVPRNASNWIVTANSVSPASTIVFSACTSGSVVATHFSVGTQSSGAGKIMYYGAITPTISISAGVTPQLTTSSYITED